MPVQHPLQRDSPSLSQDQSNALQIHNQARTAANAIPGAVPRAPLTWDSALATDAQTWATSLAAADAGLNHSTSAQRPNEGENLYWVSSGGGDGQLANAAQAWVNEGSAYGGQGIGEGNFGAYGHYTQCVWPTTTAVGMASAVGGSGAWFVVGRYSPPGNYTGVSAYTGQ